MAPGQKSKNKKQCVQRALPLSICCIQCRNAIHRGTHVFGDLNGEDFTFSCKSCPNKVTLTNDGVPVHGCLRIGESDKLKTWGIDQQSKNPNDGVPVHGCLRIGEYDTLETWGIDQQSKNPSVFDASRVKNNKNQEGYNLEAEEAEEWRKKRTEEAEEWRKKRAVEINAVIQENFLAAAKNKKRPRLEASSSGKVKSSSSESSSSSSA